MRVTAAGLVASAKAVLLDFDGPLTPLMPAPVNRQAADLARAAVPPDADPMPPDIAGTTDHLTVLRWAGTQSTHTLEAVERACIAAEVKAAKRSAPTLGALEFLRACAEQERAVVIVSNNSSEAIRSYLGRCKANGMVRGVVGRAPHHPELLKPHPSLGLAALDIVQTPPERAVIIGDSVSDIQVGAAIGVCSIGFAKTASRGVELAAAGADAVIESMSELLTST